jgi:uncharacterized membrane protein
VLLFAGVLVMLLLAIESRRYRFFDAELECGVLARFDLAARAGPRCSKAERSKVRRFTSPAEPIPG